MPQTTPLAASSCSTSSTVMRRPPQAGWMVMTACIMSSGIWMARVASRRSPICRENAMGETSHFFRNCPSASWEMKRSP
ncbi:hypothetical protein [Citrifermentans bemidjiense]|uniref:hypothetical protein n=1 Tax=Citrifermentans bemidjiense TaxID=225194 RepID=UPI001CF76BB0|nr:hypothetical protein [Citrifermentans bemidjiense]